MNIIWVDVLYDLWGSPTCPLEPHSHRHWVDYSVAMNEAFNDSTDDGSTAIMNTTQSLGSPERSSPVMCSQTDDPTQHDIEDALVSEDHDQRTALPHQYRLTYAGGEERTVKALSPKAAVILAGHGQPEQITDLTVLG